MIYFGRGIKNMKSQLTHEKFEIGPDEVIPCTFTGLQLKNSDDVTITLDQEQYLEKLEKPSTEAEFSDFRSMRMRLAWLANSRPDYV